MSFQPPQHSLPVPSLPLTPEALAARVPPNLPFEEVQKLISNFTNEERNTFWKAFFDPAVKAARLARQVSTPASLPGSERNTPNANPLTDYFSLSIVRNGMARGTPPNTPPVSLAPASESLYAHASPQTERSDTLSEHGEQEHEVDAHDVNPDAPDPHDLDSYPYVQSQIQLATIGTDQPIRQPFIHQPIDLSPLYLPAPADEDWRTLRPLQPMNLSQVRSEDDMSPADFDRNGPPRNSQPAWMHPEHDPPYQPYLMDGDPDVDLNHVSGRLPGVEEIIIESGASTVRDNVARVSEKATYGQIYTEDHPALARGSHLPPPDQRPRGPAPNFNIFQEHVQHPRLTSETIKALRRTIGDRVRKDPTWKDRRLDMDLEARTDRDEQIAAEMISRQHVLGAPRESPATQADQRAPSTRARNLSVHHLLQQPENAAQATRESVSSAQPDDRDLTATVTSEATQDSGNQPDIGTPDAGRAPVEAPPLQDVAASALQASSYFGPYSSYREDTPIPGAAHDGGY